MSVRFRCLEHEDCKAAGHAEKYLGLPGDPVRIFNTRALVEADDTIHVTEGEIDAVSLESCGLNAVGIPGSENLPAHLPRLLAGFDRVVLWADGDAAGAGMAKRFARLIPDVHIITMRAGEDVNSVLAREGKGAILLLAAKPQDSETDSE